MVLSLHEILLEGVPEKPKHPLKPGCFRDATDQIQAAGVEHLTDHVSPAWRVKSDVVSLLEDTEQGRLSGEDDSLAAGRFHYRFVRIHPFCDGNGRMARALSAFLLARNDPHILTFEKPINKVILEHREDYVGVLEYCDGIYEALREEDVSEKEKVQACELPFVIFYMKAYLTSLRAQIESLNKKALERDPAVADETVRLSQPPPDLSLEAIKNECKPLFADEGES